MAEKAILKSVHIPHLGKSLVLVNRESLRRKKDGATFRIPRHLKAVMAELPTPPGSFSWSKNGSVDYPVLGNDQYGDCYYACICHGSQTYTANAGNECSFDSRQVVQRYLELSGGDNGLGDSDAMPEWKKGIVGPNGPHKILDEMTVDPSDDASTRLAMWAFCGLTYTCALLDTWLSNPTPGQVWDGNGRPDEGAGHAIFLTGMYSDKSYELQTWGFKPCIRLTPAGLKKADPELIVAFSLEMFNASGIAPNGMTYDQLATLWIQCGGNALPPSPFGPPAPVPPGPTPPPGPSPWPPGPMAGDLMVHRDLAAGTYSVLPADAVHQLNDALAQLVKILPVNSVMIVPHELRAQLNAGKINIGKLIQIALLVMAFISAGPPTPQSIAALITQIQAILAS